MAASAGPALASASPAYYPTGPQTFVAKAALTGWTECWHSDYGSYDVNIDTVLGNCQGDFLMLAGGQTGASTWDVLAAAPRADVLFDTHDSWSDTTTTHTANGSDWYFGGNWSWGFLKAGDPRNLYQCDVDFFTNADQRLCWHTGAGGVLPDNAINYGYRAGTRVSFGSDLERAIYVSGAVDTTPPVITPTVTGTQGADGWYTTNADLSWTVSDDESPIDSQSGCDAVAVHADQASTSYTCTATSAGGTSSTSISIKRDAHAPVVTVTGPADGAVYTLGSVPAAGCDTQDTPSGVASAATLSSTGGPVGSLTATCSGATDTAGNSTAPVSATYAVHYGFSGFFQPIDTGILNALKAGSAVPVKFSLAGNRGLSILAAGSPSSQPITCDAGTPVDAVEETVTAGSSSLSYDATTDQYNYVWKTDKAWAGSCRQLTVKLIDGTSHTAKFKFTK